jgi:hypothetical protein
LYRNRHRVNSNNAARNRAAGHAPAASHEDVSIVIGAGNMHHEQVISVRAPAGVMGGLPPRMHA